MWHFLALIGAAMPMTNPTWQSDKRLQRRECLRMHTVALQMQMRRDSRNRLLISTAQSVEKTTPRNPWLPFPHFSICFSALLRWLDFSSMILYSMIGHLFLCVLPFSDWLQGFFFDLCFLSLALFGNLCTSWILAISLPMRSLYCTGCWYTSPRLIPWVTSRLSKSYASENLKRCFKGMLIRDSMGFIRTQLG